MQITKVSVKYAQLVSTGNYEHVRPSVQLAARIEAEENPDLVTRELFARARQLVCAQVDEVLMEAGQKPRYCRGPLYVVWHIIRHNRRVIAITPTDTPMADGWPLHPGATLEVARSWAARRAADYGGDVIDCSDGDISRLPDLEEDEESEGSEE